MTKILIVDDQRSLRGMLRAILEDVDLKDVEEAEDGNAALAKLRSAHVDLLITDWNMPNVNGIDLLKAVRADASLKELPVIMLTGEAARDHVIEAIKLGVSGFIKKPFNPEDLVNTVQRAIQQPAKAG